MRFWVVHTSVLQDMVCFVPGIGKLSCLDFVKWIIQQEKEGVALDIDGKILNDYIALKEIPATNTTSLYNQYMKVVLLTDRKTNQYPSILDKRIKHTLEVRDGDKFLIYLGVAASADKLLAHSKRLKDITVKTIKRTLNVSLHDVSNKKWKTVV